MRRFYAFETLVSFQLWSPFWTLWLFAHATPFVATLIDVVFWIVSLLIAMPAGAFADRYGRKRAVIIGVGIWIVGIVLFGLATDFLTFALANAVWAFGAGFMWNSGSAYLYDTLLEVRLEDRYPVTSSRLSMFSFLGTAMACAAGGLVVSTFGRFDLPLILYALPGAAALAIAFTFEEPSVPRESAPTMFSQIASGLRTTRANRQIVLVIAFQVIVGLVAYMMGFFRPKLLDDVVGGDFLLMGLVYSGFFIVAALSGLSVSGLLKRFGEAGALLVTFLLVFPPFALVYLVSVGFFDPFWSLAFGVLAQVPFYMFWGTEAPVITTILNRRLASTDRATVLAISSFFGTLVIFMVEPVVGLVSTDSGIGLGLATLALAAAAPTAYALLAFHRSGFRATARAAVVDPKP